MSDAAKTRRRLWDSLELQTLRRDAIVSTLAVVIIVGLRGCADAATNADAWIITAVVFLVTLLPFWCFWIVRTIRIFRKPERYIFCRCVLNSPHQQPFLRGAMYFSVVLEDSQGRRLPADTHAIFQSHGAMGPLLEEYINRTVTVAYNEDTGMVVVIG